MRRSVKALTIALLAGILITGIGAGVTFFELSGITYAGEKDLSVGNIQTKELELVLPKGDMKLFYRYDLINIVEDSNVEAGRAVVEYSASAGTTVDAGFYDEMYIYSLETGHVSPNKYRFLNVFIHSQGEDMDRFRAFMEDIKNRQVYTYVTPDVSVTIRVNPQEFSRFELFDAYNYGTLDYIPHEVEEYRDALYYDFEEDSYYTCNAEGKPERVYPIYQPEEEYYEYAREDYCAYEG